MKKLLTEYSKIIGLTFTGLVFGLSFFLLILNFYHVKEVSQVHVKTESDKIVIQEIMMKLEQAQINISNFNANLYIGNDDVTELLTLQAGLQICIDQFYADELRDLFAKEEMTINDVYHLQRFFQNNILSDCIVRQTYDLTVTGPNARYSIESLSMIAPFIRLNADSLLRSTNYIRRVIENNSNYAFSSSYSKDNFLEMTRDSYNEVMNAYNDAADYILYLSIWFNEITRGVR